MSVTSSAGPSQATVETIKEKARRLSILSMMATTAAGSGHPTSCMSAAELMAGIFFYAMKFDPKNPNSNDDDRFVLSKGHAAPGSLCRARGGGRVSCFARDDAAQFSSELEGHPTPRIHGVDAATGSLGQGLSVGAGLAIGARMDKSATRVYVLLGDGEMAEGQIWEAAEFAGHYKLDNLTVIADVNALGQSEPTMYQHDMETYRKKFESEGFATEVIDGHDVSAVLAALDRAKATKGRPQAIVARTIKGHGFSQVAGKMDWHGKPFSKDQLARRHQEIGGTPPVVVPPDPGKSYVRKPLPKPPDFPGAACAGLRGGKAGGDTRSVRLCAEAARRRESARRGDFRRREEFDVLGIFRRCLSRSFLSGLHRRAEYGERRRGPGRARQGAIPRYVRVLSVARVRPGAHGRDQPQQYQSVRFALRSLDRRGRPFANGARRPGDDFAPCTARRCFIRATRCPPSG